MKKSTRTAVAFHSLFHLFLRITEHKDIRSGQSLHGHLIKAGLWADIFLCNCTLNMYAKCNGLPDAVAAFDEMHSHDVVSWNFLINSYSHLASVGSHIALQLFQRMRTEPLLPNAFTFAGVFAAASTAADDGLAGRQAHCVAVKTASCANVFVGSSLLSMYSKQGFISDARKVFDRMPIRNSVSWASMISAYAAADNHEIEAFELFKLMLLERDCDVNEFVLTSVLSSLCLAEFLGKGRQVHCLAIKNGLVSFVPVANSLVTLYAKCERMDDALLMFETSGVEKNSISWSAVITGYAQNGDPDKALNFFAEMHSAGFQPNEFTFVGVLNACADRMALAEAKQAHGCLLKLGFDPQMYVKSALVDIYAKCGFTEDARKGFHQLHEQADVVLWSTMIGGYAQNGEHEQALTLYARMEKEGVLPNHLTMASVLKACSNLAALEQGKQVHARTLKYGFSLDIPIGSALSTMYAKCGNLDDCRLVVRRMHRRDIIAWNSIIAGFSQNGRGREALELFEEMKLEGTKPDHVTFVNLLCACSHMGLVEKGWYYFRLMKDEYGVDPRVEHYACMVDILTRGGMFEDAKELIGHVPIDHGMNLWRIVLGACRDRRNFDIGAYAGEKLMELGSEDSSAYTLLSNIYAIWNRWDDVERVRRTMRFRGVNKDPGCSWIELKSQIHVFVSREHLHPETDEIYKEVKRLTRHMKLEGYLAAYGLPSHDYSPTDYSATHQSSFPSLLKNHK